MCGVHRDGVAASMMRGSVVYDGVLSHMIWDTRAPVTYCGRSISFTVKTKISFMTCVVCIARRADDLESRTPEAIR